MISKIKTRALTANHLRVLRRVGIATAVLALLPAVCAGVAFAQTTYTPASVPPLEENPLTGANAPTQLEGPEGIAVDGSGGASAGDLYVATSVTSKAQVEKFTATGEYICQLNLIEPCGSSGTGFFYPAGVAAGPNGEVYVGNEPSIDRFSASGAYEAEVTGSETPEEELALVYGLAVGPSGELYVDNDAFGTIDRFEGATGKYELQLTASQTPQGEWDLETGGDLAVDSEGYVYVVDREHELVDVFTPAGAYDTQFSVPSEPTAVAVDPSTDDVLVALSSGVIARYSRFGGQLLSEFESTLAGAVHGLALDASGEFLYSAEDGRSPAEVEVFERVIAPTPVTEGCTPAATGTALTLEGSVNPEGLPAKSLFEYGTSTSYEATATAVQGAGGPDPGSAEDGDGTSAVSVEATLGGLVPHSVYAYRLKGVGAEGEEEGAGAQCDTATIAPVVDEAPVSATSVTNPTATGSVQFTGTVNAEHDPTTYHFDYGTTPELGQSTTEASLGETYGGYEITQIVSGLQPDTEYHYQLVASNEAGEEIVSPLSTFVTAPEAVTPGVETGSASSVAQTGASVAGTVDPAGHATTYAWELSNTETACPASASELAGAAGAGEAGAGTTSVPVSASFSDLEPGATYHYRLVASSESGTSCGADRTFTTPAYTFALTVPAAPVFLATPKIGVEPKAAAPTVKITKHAVKGKTIILTVKSPAKGKLTATGTGLMKKSKSVNGAATYKLKVNLTAAERKKLERKKKLKLTVRVMFKPSSGKSSSGSVKVSLRS